MARFFLLCEGNLTWIKDAQNHETNFTYEFNRLKTKTDPLSYIWQYFYDLNGNLDYLIDPNNNSIDYDYDEINRLKTKTLYDNPTQTPPWQDQVDYTYDSVSSPLSVSDNDSSLTMTYYLNGWLKTVNNGIDTISYTYDKVGNRKTMTDIEDGVTNYYYTTLNQLDYFTNPSGKVTDYGYDDLSRRDSIQFHNGTDASLGYDETGKLLNLVNELTGTPFSSYVYTHDGVGNRETMEEDGYPGNPHTYDYDDLYRLTDATHPQPANPTEGYSYDGVGNRLTSAGYPTWSYDDNNRLTSYNGTTFGYDNNGNMTSKTVGGTEITTYQYDIENRLERIDYPGGGGYSEYKYDPFGRRIKKDVNGTITQTITKYLYDGEDILFELDGSNQIISRFIHGPGIDEPVILERDADVYYYHTDGLGSVTKLTDATGTVVQFYLYDSFGYIVAQSGSVTQTYTYTGRENDAESGLYYYRFRYYNPEVGRFLSEDPLSISTIQILKENLRTRVIGNLLYQYDLQNPQVLNVYLYVENDPLNWVDPWGLHRIPGALGNIPHKHRTGHDMDPSNTSPSEAGLNTLPCPNAESIDKVLPAAAEFTYEVIKGANKLAAGDVTGLIDIYDALEDYANKFNTK